MQHTERSRRNMHVRICLESPTISAELVGIKVLWALIIRTYVTFREPPWKELSFLILPDLENLKLIMNLKSYTTQLILEFNGLAPVPSRLCKASSARIAALLCCWRNICTIIGRHNSRETLSTLPFFSPRTLQAIVHVHSLHYAAY